MTPQNAALEMGLFFFFFFFFFLLRGILLLNEIDMNNLSWSGLTQMIMMGESINGLIYTSRIVRKPDFCLGENKGADQLRGNREADQRLCFRYSDSTIPLLLKYEISSF